MKTKLKTKDFKAIELLACALNGALSASIFIREIKKVEGPLSKAEFLKFATIGASAHLAGYIVTKRATKRKLAK